MKHIAFEICFKEVIVDFDGIIWIGQGFAHQLFVIFANAHQDIKLISFNMNEDVTKMYNHMNTGMSSLFLIKSHVHPPSMVIICPVIYLDVAIL